MIQPIDQLLDDRGVDFGDDYPRSTLTAFGLDNRLDCLPYGVEPSVIYYNKRLVKLRQVSADPPVPGQGWSLDQFAATARWAVSRHPQAAGAYVDPTLGGVAPFVLSGGGQIFDGATPPTTLTLSSDASQQALIRTVRVMHRPGISLTPQQLAEKTPAGVVRERPAGAPGGLPGDRAGAAEPARLRLRRDADAQTSGPRRPPAA